MSHSPPEKVMPFPNLIVDQALLISADIYVEWRRG